MAGLIICTVFSSAFAGNTEMVKGSVEELDAINKEAVRQIPDIPGDGRIELEAEGTQYDEKVNVRVKRYRIGPIDKRSVPLDEGAVNSDGKEEKNDEG